MTISPREFLRKRRPKQFSDSLEIIESPINRMQLEYYLESLGSRNQEAEFENFGIKICRAVISPNFMPNTGPAGGGDAKVDSETYPVSKTTSLGWYTCIDEKAKNERWGLAISTQENWKSKVKADVEKASKTDRKYKVFYFLSSRYIRAKEKSQTQDTLSKQYKMDVRILDRKWILDEIFEKKLEYIAKNELNIDCPDCTKAKKGPLDTQREERLEDLEKKITQSIAENKVNAVVVQDTLKAAILSRQLEKPRIETDGRFLRAVKLCKECKSEDLEFDCVYEWAWTTFWWHEDFSEYMKLYKKAEKLAIQSNNVYVLERWSNLRQNLRNIQNQDSKLVSKKYLDEHTEILRKKLKEISAEKESRPSGSLYARFLYLELELIEGIISGEKVGPTLLELKEVVEESKHLIGFPFKPHIDVLVEAGKMLEGVQEYDVLFDTMVKIVGERDGDVAAAKLHLDRGENLIKGHKYYEAIQELGKILVKLFKHESKDEIVEALHLISIAYEEVGLLWAARGALLSAAALATNDLWMYNDINSMQASCSERLKWLELRLGRLPQVLDWYMVDSCIKNILVEKGCNTKNINDERTRFDLALGIPFLMANKTELGKLENLPDTLFKLGFEFSPIALLYALGCIENIPDYFKEEIPEEERETFFNNWASQYSPEFPKTIVPNNDNNIILKSNILGCSIAAYANNESPEREIAESILAAFESFMSTIMLHRGIACEPTLDIFVDVNEDQKTLLSYKISDDSGQLTIHINAKKFNPHSLKNSDRIYVQKQLQKCLFEVMGRLIIFKDASKDLQKIFVEESAAERSAHFSSSFITLGNVLGKQPNSKLSDRIPSVNKRYKYKREKPLNFSLPEMDDKEKPSREPNEDVIAKAKHSEMKIDSVIKVGLWDKAKWLGAGYLVMLDNSRAPILAILFENIEIGRKIFTNWRNEFGIQDESERIRVTIMRAIDAANPMDYRIGIGTNIHLETLDPKKLVVSATRIHTMNPTSTENLDRFEKSFEKLKVYLLVPGIMGKDGIPVIDHNQGIIKKSIHFRRPMDVGPNDPDIVLLDRDKN